MKPWKTILLLGLTLISIFAVGCGLSTTNTVTPSSVAPTPPIDNATPTPILTQSLTDTPTPIPTLPVEQAGVRLLDLLANNGGCRLPCMWGITPGKSTYQEALSILEPFSAISELTSFKSESGAISPVYAEGDLMLNTNVGFLSDNQIVSHITFRARELKKWESGTDRGVDSIFDSSSFGERLHPYMLPQVLSEQGVPTAVLISTHGGPEGSRKVPGFYIVLLYPDQGLLVRYTTSRQLAGKNVLGCLSNAHVELQLYPAGNSDAFSNLLDQSWKDIISGYKHLDEVTSMSLEQFYETFRQPTDKCIETPAKLWPTPEPGGG